MVNRQHIVPIQEVQTSLGQRVGAVFLCPTMLALLCRLRFVHMERQLSSQIQRLQHQHCMHRLLLAQPHCMHCLRLAQPHSEQQ